MNGRLRVVYESADFTSRGNLSDLMDRYHWQRIERIRLRSRWRLLIGRSLRISRDKGYDAAKRAIDVAGAVLLILLAFPLLSAVALAVTLTDFGPALFWQKRIGLHGREFDFPKFRSMVPNAEKLLHLVRDQSHHGESITFKMKRDPRVTWIGRIIRRFSIDELPQLWCVLMGDMTLVGPRPALPREVARYRLAERRRLDVKPGLTCFWQVRGRGDLPFHKQLELDVEYIERQNLTLDLKLLFLTVPAVLFGRGAY